MGSSFNTDDGTAAQINLNLYDDDVATVEDFYDNHRSRQLSPSKRLLLAILDNAIDFLRKKNKIDPETRKPRRKESCQWILADDDDNFFSFVNVCEMLDINPAYLRKALVEKYPILKPIVNQPPSGNHSAQPAFSDPYKQPDSQIFDERGEAVVTITFHGQTLPAAYDRKRDLKVHPLEFLPVVLTAWRKRQSWSKKPQWGEDLFPRKTKAKKVLPKVRCRHAGTNAWMGYWKGKFDRYRSCEPCRQVHDHAPNEGGKPVKPEVQVSLSPGA